MRQDKPRLRVPIVGASLASIVFLGACSSLTGLGGSDEYGCKAPTGVKCESVSGTYHNALQNNLPSQRPQRSSRRSDSAPAQSPTSWHERPPQNSPMTAAAVATDTGGGEKGGAVYTPRPLRTQAKVLRLWFKAYEDSDRDLNDQGFVFVQIDSGHWLIDHAQRQAREAFAPIRPPRTLGRVTQPGADARSAVARPSPSSPEDSTWPAAQMMRGLQGAGARGTQDGDK